MPAPLAIRSDKKPRAPPIPGAKTKSPHNAVLFVNFSNPTVDRKSRNNRSAIKKWVTKRQHAVARNTEPFHLNSENPKSSSRPSLLLDIDGTVDEEADAEIVSPSARSLITTSDTSSAGRTDPFDVLPIPGSRSVFDLLYAFLSASTVSLSVVPDKAASYAKFTLVRKNAWHPLALQSRAAYSALVAYAQVTKGLITDCWEINLRQYMMMALTACNEELAKIKTGRDSDALCYAVVLLMVIAQRTNDPDSFHAHARGLSALIYRRARARMESEDSPRSRQRQINSETQAVAIMPKRWESLTLPPEKLSPTIPQVAGFHKMMRLGHMSTGTAAFLAQAVAIIELSNQARGDWLIVNSMYQHSYFDDSVARRMWPHSPAEIYLVLCTRLVQHHAIFTNRQHPCRLSTTAITSLHRQMQAKNIDVLLDQCPEAMLWVALIGGSGIDNDLQHWFAWLMRESCARLPEIQTFEDARILLYEEFLWAPGADFSAAAFWDMTFKVWDEGAGPDHEGMRRRFSSSAPSVKEKPIVDSKTVSPEASTAGLMRGPTELGLCDGKLLDT